jgi:hypothetical protein
MADSPVPSRALSDRTALDRDLSSETANFMGYDSPRVSSHLTVKSPAGVKRSGTPVGWTERLSYSNNSFISLTVNGYFLVCEMR